MGRVADHVVPALWSWRATAARGAHVRPSRLGLANEARNKLRYAWPEFLQHFDVLLTTVAATGAFPHDHGPDRDQRLIPVNNRMLPYYGDQRFCAGVASLSLPAGDLRPDRFHRAPPAGRAADRQRGGRRPDDDRIRNSGGSSPPRSVASSRRRPAPDASGGRRCCAERSHSREIRRFCHLAIHGRA